MKPPIHEDAISAWHYLCEKGGLELDGRDEGLEGRICDHLNPNAESLEEALSTASLEAFVEAFFHSLHPYIEMFRNILGFFEHGKATKGESQWILRVGDVDLDLEHFRKWLNNWDAIANSEINVPAIDKKAVWQLWERFRERQSIHNEIRKSFGNEVLNVKDDVRAWVVAYNNDNYLPLPASLLPPQCPSELEACASIAHAALKLLLNLGLTPSSLKALYDNRIAQDPSDGLEFRNISQNETDYWLKTFVVAISAATSLSNAELRKLGEELGSITSRFHTRPLEVSVTIKDLESVLSLPIWKKRYDLFSVWIATEIIRALNAHDVEIHHDNGRIAFSFHETHIATVHSSLDSFRLISERRIPLENPRGEGRKAGVQPDYGLWALKNGKEFCGMAVEVKHYKRSNKSKFVAMFEDYARAVEEGKVYLVNHGPISESVYDLSWSVRDRCFAIGKLTTSNWEAREQLASAVQKCIGEPVKSWPKPSETAASDKVLLLDVSGSMSLIMRSEEMSSFIRNLTATELPKKLAAADTKVVGEWEPSELGFSEILYIDGGSTDLLAPVMELLSRYNEVILVTDSDGLSGLKNVAVSEHKFDKMAPPSIKVRVCTSIMNA
ncbi:MULTISPECIES: hypothetical protein [unclassified Halomonas]|uniref:hypothetical protein n=1 Tax=unclassified Halomonas TaxID=2609666 RepID=UPI0007DA1956|nr:MULTISPECIES: hypothetical protein [unclassified Halomonas]MBT2785700.1 hypothetical protein [Halomonas sp. ISL-106]MBT2798754.1 hypothetical protein [Halomonas sp. ISL-104]OAL59123.1 hypothetical protein A6R74_04835 [Halomonas sp. ALS9]